MAEMLASGSQGRIRTLPRTRLAYLHSVGPYGGAGARHKRSFGDWLQALGAASAPVYGLVHDDPRTTPDERCRCDCCLPMSTHFGPQGVIAIQEFTGGLHACAQFRRHGALAHAAWL